MRRAKAVEGGGIWRGGVGILCRLVRFVGEVTLHNGEERRIDELDVVELELLAALPEPPA